MRTNASATHSAEKKFCSYSFLDIDNDRCKCQQINFCCGRASQAYKFERLQPLSYYASAEQRGAAAGAGLFWRVDPEQEALAARCRMLRHSPASRLL